MQSGFQSGHKSASLVEQRQMHDRISSLYMQRWRVPALSSSACMTRITCTFLGQKFNSYGNALILVNATPDHTHTRLAHHFMKLKWADLFYGLGSLAGHPMPIIPPKKPTKEKVRFRRFISVLEKN